MSAFDFSLQKVLELRERQEEQSARELADAKQQADKARQLHTDLRAARDAGRARMALANWGGGAVGHLQNLVDAVGRVDAQVTAAETECGHAEEQVEESIKAVKKAARERKIIDRLRERRLDKWRLEQADNERKTMDEFALSRHWRAAQSNSKNGD